MSLFRRNIMIANSSSHEIVLKNYITTTEDGQYLVFDGISAPLENTQLEVVYQTADDTKITNVISLSGNVYIQSNRAYCAPYNTNRLSLYAITKNNDITAGLNSANGYCFVNDNSGTCTTPSTAVGISSGVSLWKRGNTHDSIAGVVKVKSVTITTPNDTYTFVPALINEEPVLYDATHAMIAREANGGTLAVE